jgi:predicted amidophosphoribosyltransferase
MAGPAALRRLARRIHRTLVDPLLDFLLPTDCFACGEPLGPTQRLGACAACWSGLKPLEPPLCPACGLPRPRTTDLLGPAGGRCAACVLSPPAASLVRAAVAYDRCARAFLLRAKLGGRRELFGPLGGQLVRAVEHAALAEGCTVVVPVPSHPWVALRRGFHPALELARPVARRLGLPVARVLARRTRSGPPAKRLGARRRRAVARGAFRVRRPLDRARVLLVDDVMTTGATADACAAALLSAGAVEVRIATWARTLLDDPG